MSVFSKHRLLPWFLSLLLLSSSCITISTEGNTDSINLEETQAAIELTQIAIDLNAEIPTAEASQSNTENNGTDTQAPPQALGSSFGAAVKWSDGVCHKGCYFADVTGDGKADFIAHDNDGINVVPSSGSGFGPQYSNWTGAPVDCDNACYFSDATGDGKADFIAYDNDGIYILPSIGSR